MRLRLLHPAVFALCLSACLDRPATGTPERTDNIGAKTDAVAPSALVELPVGAGNASAFPLAPGSFITGSLPAREGPAPKVLAVQIGNFANTTDGELVVELCRAGQCTSGQADLSRSVDNTYLEVHLGATLGEDTSGAPFRYRIVKSGGSQPVAIWLYALNAEQESPKANDQFALERAPKLAMRF